MTRAVKLILATATAGLLASCARQVAPDTGLETAAVVGTETRCGYELTAGTTAQNQQQVHGYLELKNVSGELMTSFDALLELTGEVVLREGRQAVFTPLARAGRYRVSQPDRAFKLKPGQRHRINFRVDGRYAGLKARLDGVNGRPCTEASGDGEKFVGNIWRNGDTPDDPTAADFLSYWNQVTPENAGKWGGGEPQRDVMNWADLDAAYTFATANALPFKFHTLVWGQQQPAWLDGLAGTEQREEIEEWIALLAARYPDPDFIDVVNEPLHAPATYKEALGGDGQTGWDWVITSFELARDAFPGSALLLNDYDILYLEQATGDYLEIIELLQARGLIDGVGLQGHNLERADLATLASNLERLAATGLPIYLSELDVDLADDARQANVLRDLFTLFYENDAVKGVTLWGYKENQHWRENAYLLREDGSERPALTWLTCYLAGNSGCTVPTYVPEPRVGDGVKLKFEAEDYDAAQGIVASGSVISYVDAGDWALYRGVALGPGYDAATLRYAKGSTAAGTLSLHLGSLDGPVIGRVTVPSTGDWNTFETLTFPLEPTSGVYDVYVRFSDADAFGNVDFFELGRPAQTGTGERLTLEAETYDAQQGTETFGSFIGYADDGDYLRFSNVRLEESYTLFEATYARGFDGTGTVEVRLDAPGGPLAATLTPRNTGDFNTFVSDSVPLRAGAGVYDLYLVFRGGEALGNFDTFALLAGELPPRVGDERGLRLEAESFDGGGEVEVFGTVVGYVDDGDALIYKNVAFRESYDRFILRYAKGNPDAAQVQLRLDGAAATPLAIAELPTTGDWNAYAELEAQFRAAARRARRLRDVQRTEPLRRRQPGLLRVGCAVSGVRQG